MPSLKSEIRFSGGGRKKMVNVVLVNFLPKKGKEKKNNCQKGASYDVRFKNILNLHVIFCDWTCVDVFGHFWSQGFGKSLKSFRKSCSLLD